MALQLATSVVHLGNRLTSNLSDDDDILLKTRYMSRAANSLFASFGNIGPVPLTYLFQSYCLVLYGCALWKLSCRSLKTLVFIAVLACKACIMLSYQDRVNSSREPSTAQTSWCLQFILSLVT